MGIPEDVAMEILSRLPVKSIMRFKCVCKYWYDLFLNENFIAKHQLQQEVYSQNKFRFLVSLGRGFEGYGFEYFNVIDDGDEILTTTEKLYVPSSTKTFQCQPRVLGPCNGLLCLYDFNFNIEFWNPATRELKSAPMTSVQRLRDSLPPAVLGFGFDRKTKDYKVVRLLQHRINIRSSTNNSWPYQIELYSLKSDSWREIHAKLDINSPVLNGGVYNDGVCYWLADREANWLAYGEGNFILLSFCMAEEAFQKVPMPDFDVYLPSNLLRLSIFSGFVSLTMCSRGFGTSETWFLMTKHGGMEPSWVKQANIRLPNSVVWWPLRIRKNGDLFCENPYSGNVILNKQQSLEIKIFEINGRLEVMNNVDSLVRIGAGVGEGEDEDE